MPDTFTDEYNLVKPEIGGSIDTWGTKLNQNADVLEQTLLRIEESLVGMLSHFPIDSGTPSGWLRCDGSTYGEGDYPRLFARIGRTFGGSDVDLTFKVPDYRGVFLRGLDEGKGLDPGRGLTGTQPDQNKQHNHGGSTNNAGGHSHGASSESSGYHSHSGSANSNGHHSHSANIGNNGNHDHAYELSRAYDSTGPYVDDNYFGGGQPSYRRTARGKISHDGNHSHSISINGNGNHGHSLDINGNGSHKHTITVNYQSSHDHGINNEGGDEARPVNMAALICIKT